MTLNIINCLKFMKFSYYANMFGMSLICTVYAVKREMCKHCFAHQLIFLFKAQTVFILMFSIKTVLVKQIDGMFRQTRDIAELMRSKKVE